MPPKAMTRDGWARVPDDGFIELAGPLWQREADCGMELAIATTDKHRNRSGIVQGGVLCTLADRALGTASRAASGNPPQVTVKLDTTFLDRVEVGDVLVARPRVVRQTRTLSFGAVDLLVNERLFASATGVFRLR